MLLVAHTDASPRGFTLLCRRLGARLAEVGSAGLGVALTREWIVGEASRLHAAFAELGGLTSGTSSGATSSAITSNQM